MVKKYHAVTRGKRPGLYNSFEEAQQQVIGFPGSKVKTFPNLKFAVEHMLDVGRVPDDDIRTGKRAHSLIQECIDELKDPPYVNILDFVDVFRTGETIRTFSDPLIFRDYTRENPIYLKYAKKSEFLCPFLQDLQELRRLPSKPRRDRQVNGSRQESRARKDSALLLSPRPGNKFVKPEMSNDSHMVPPVGNYQSSLDHPPLSPPLSESGSEKPSTNVKIEPTSSVMPAQVLDDIGASLEDDKEIATQLLQQPSKAEVGQDIPEDMFQDDEEISTQLSQQPSKAEVGEDISEDMLEYMIQDDKEISTQLTQEWHITGPEESSRTKTTGKRKQSLASDLTHTVKRAGKMLKTHR
ncbi:unnamed protein product [Alternaria alternata]|uniref:Ribonuclease H1 N-terminal domain-containing protein n=1 Tax=Alternaria tenuissima TaxID=119927 RepID=A0AB37W655_9PLEO|nr:hypothetical protein AA0115_g10123 [Alternaria tenuissima]RYN47532.1 hypothetical protein AA0118_g12167 [Alternaria tenuissima]RYN92482.1 hypothetical protein AA0120_g4642 [Alternaria tenuissima]RYN97044.1 hypothetical protein AA0119_g7828 [Alternaria tenuissima]RYO11510.1 hypothetical protein AA0121_g9854 [Alternaria tenuissima]